MNLLNLMNKSCPRLQKSLRLYCVVTLIKKGESMAEVQVIKASEGKVNRRTGKVIQKLRVAAYCRVSTDSDEQLSSYNSQVTHYTD